MYYSAVHPLIWAGLACLATIMLAKSFKIPRADQGIEIYFFAQHRKTVVPHGFIEGLTDEQRRRCGVDTKEHRKSRKIGTEPLDIVFRLYPFWSLTRFSTSPTTLMLYASEIFTKKIAPHPRVRLSAKPSLGIRFITIRNTILGAGFNNFDNLTIEDEITGQNQGKELLKYRDTFLAKGLREKTKDSIRDALRKAATNFFWDSGEDPDAKKDEFEINSSKKLWEKTALFEMAAPESVFSQSHILTRPNSVMNLEPDTHPDQFWAELRKLKIVDFFGADILSMDTNIPKMDLSRMEEGSSDAEKAVNTRYVSIQTAAATKTEGEAEAQVIKSRAVATAEGSERQGQADAVSAAALQGSLKGADPAVLAGLLLLKDKDVKIVPIGGNIPEIIRNVVGGGKTE